MIEVKSRSRNMLIFSFTVLLLLTGNLVISEANQKIFYEVEDYESLFEEFIVKYERMYEDEEEKRMRAEIFKKRLEVINELNARNEHTVFGVNMFSDYTEEEFKRMTGFKVRDSQKNVCKTIQVNENSILLDAEEDEFDWRKHNAVTPVKSQDSCGSCWTFSTVGNIEGQHAIKNKELVDLSPQQLVDCDKNEGEGGGCDGGGDMTFAMTALIDMGGIMTEADYPYKNKDQECRFDKSKVKVKLTGCNWYNVTSEEKLKTIVKITGPLSIGLYAGPDLISYVGGIISKGCGAEEANHAVLLVGWGSENNVPYWIIKNSWSTRFGESGYFRIKRGINALCFRNYDSTISVAVL